MASRSIACNQALRAAFLADRRFCDASGAPSPRARFLPCRIITNTGRTCNDVDATCLTFALHTQTSYPLENVNEMQLSVWHVCWGLRAGQCVSRFERATEGVYSNYYGRCHVIQLNCSYKGMLFTTARKLLRDECGI